MAATEPAWWRTLGAPQLDALIERALAANTDLAAAAARIRQARAAEFLASAARWPALGLNAAVERQDFSRRQTRAGGSSAAGDGSGSGADGLPALGDGNDKRERTQHSLDLQASYEIDWLGRNALATEAARSQRAAAVYDEAAARVAVAASVIDAYADLSLAQRQHDLAQAQAVFAAETVRAEERRLLAGLTTRRNVRERDDDRFRALLAIEEARQQRTQALGRLAVLLGEPAHRYAAVEADGAVLAQLADRVPPPAADQPATVIGCRPDVQAAWQRLEAAAGDSERARLERYPRLTLTSSLGFVSETLRRWLERDALAWVAGLRGTVPLLDGGRLRAQVDQAKATRDEREAEYRKTVLTALQEVESALMQFETSGVALGYATALVQRRDNDERGARAELAAGRINSGGASDAARAALAARDELARAQRAHVQSYLSLQRALGVPDRPQQPAAGSGDAGRNGEERR